MKREKFLTVRLTENQLLLIKQVAQLEDRSISSQALRFIIQGVETYFKKV